MAAAKEGWDFACPDWAERLKAGESLIPELPLDAKEAARAIAIFNRLRLPDVAGTPALGDAAGDWIRDLVARCSDRSTQTACGTWASSSSSCRRRTRRRPAARRSC
jgi:phage terminase large subunit-like protein